MWPALGGVEGCEQSAISRAPFRTESAETDGKKGSMPPAKERHELAHVVQLSGFMPNRHCHGAGASCGIVKTRAQFCMDME